MAHHRSLCGPVTRFSPRRDECKWCVQFFCPALCVPLEALHALPSDQGSRAQVVVFTDILLILVYTIIQAITFPFHPHLASWLTSQVKPVEELMACPHPHPHPCPPVAALLRQLSGYEEFLNMKVQPSLKNIGGLGSTTSGTKLRHCR